MTARSVKIINGGKLVIPAQFRREMGIGAGDTVVVEMTDGRTAHPLALVRHQESASDSARICARPR